MKVKDIESRAINEEKQLQFFITRVSLSIESAIKYIYIYRRGDKINFQSF